MNDTFKRKLELLGQLEELVSLKRKKSCEGSFLKFISVYLGHLTGAKTPDFHLEMMGLMERMESLTRLLFIAPRGFAKSTLCSVFFPLWLAVYGKKKDLFIVSATISLAKEHLRKIRNELENNEKLKKDFGELQSDKWTEEMLILTNGVVIRAKGREFQIRGFRPDLIVCDDLEDEEVVNSREQREKMEQWFFRTLLPALKPEQGLLYVGTNLHQMSLISKLSFKEEFTARKWKALDGGRSIWEEYFPAATLLKLKSELGTYAFEAEYQNNPLSLTDQPIKPHYLEAKIGGERQARCLAIDPAISEKEKADYRAFAIFDRTTDGFKEVFSERGRWGIEEQIERVIDLFEKYRPDRVVVEEVAFQKVFKHILLEKSRKKGVYIPVSEARLGVGQDKRPRSKLTRLLGVSHLFEQSLVEIKNPDLKTELLSFPNGDYDDMVDATVYALQWLMDYRSGAFMVKKEEVSVVKGRDSFTINEVRPGVFIAQHSDLGKRMRPSLRIINYDKG